eukprot:10266964-Heterocapsa_arctica.AAC.1
MYNVCFVGQQMLELITSGGDVLRSTKLQIWGFSIYISEDSKKTTSQTVSETLGSLLILDDITIV